MRHSITRSMHPLLLLLIGVLIMALPAHGQDTAETTWYWAINRNAGSLIAYTADGQVNTLIESGMPDESIRAWRIAPDEAIMLLPTDEGLAVNWLTPETATQAAHVLPEGNYVPLAVSEAATLLYDPQPIRAGRLTASNAYLINHTPMPMPITPLPKISYRGIAFSADGSVLRYARIDSEDPPVVVLAERDLATGTERDLYTFAPTLALTNPVANGEMFVSNYFNGETRQATFQSVDLAGNVTTLAENQAGDPPPGFKLVGAGINRSVSHYVTYDFQCKSDCTITVSPFVGGGSLDGNSATFILPTIGVDILPLYFYPADTDHGVPARLLVDNGDSLWLLGADGSAFELGMFDPQYGVTRADTITPDGRYLLTFYVDEHQSGLGYRLWDVSNQAVVMDSGGVDPDLHIVVSNLRTHTDGILLGEDGLRWRLLLGGRVKDLPEERVGHYFEAQPDGSILFAQARPGDDGSVPGIYRYDPAADTYTLIAADAEPVVG